MNTDKQQMPSSFWNTALEQEALHSWAHKISVEQLLTVCAWHPKGMPGKGLYTLAIAMALVSCNKAFSLIFEEQMLITVLLMWILTSFNDESPAPLMLWVQLNRTRQEEEIIDYKNILKRLFWPKPPPP